MGKQNAVIYLNFIRAFDRFSHYIPMTKLEKYWLDARQIGWFSNHFMLLHKECTLMGQYPEFSGGPVVRTWHFHFWGPGFDPWSGIKILKKEKEKKKWLLLSSKGRSLVLCCTVLFSSLTNVFLNVDEHFLWLSN